MPRQRKTAELAGTAVITGDRELQRAMNKIAAEAAGRENIEAVLLTAAKPLEDQAEQNARGTLGSRRSGVQRTRWREETPYPTVRVYPGWWGWLFFEYGTDPHPIGPRRGKALGGGDLRHPHRAVIEHPGISKPHGWLRSAYESKKETVERLFGNELMKLFRARWAQ